ncbi:hypothetical protein PRUPE_2G022200 [Prunus persica]|uniref:Uncharacterized protein n=1 Tax=Prunus persica TaxID=3760 RepID=A0A251Q9P3_PRUPE|nr:hypothetical protein PRUPE_2G022200 [Prunus persica]
MYLIEGNRLRQSTYLFIFGGWFCMCSRIAQPMIPDSISTKSSWCQPSSIHLGASHHPFIFVCLCLPPKAKAKTRKRNN